MSQLAIAFVALLATGAVLWATRPRDASRLYDLANASYNAGQFADAARQFQQFADDYPDDRRCAEVLSLLGQVEFGINNNSERALEAYSRVAGAPGQSEWKRQALLEIGGIQRQCGNYSEAIGAFESLDFEYGSDTRTHVQAQLELAETYLRSGKADLARECCQAVLDLGIPQSERQGTVRALQLLSRIAQTLTRDEAAALEPLKEIVRSFPGTAEAEAANRELAYLQPNAPRRPSGQTSPTGPAAASPKSAPAASSAVLVDLPLDKLKGVGDEGLFECLGALAAVRDVRATREDLVAYTGAAFAVWYSARDRLVGDRVWARDPVLAAGERLGLTGATRLTATAEAEALTLLKQQIHRKLAVLVPLVLDGRPTWRIVCGYDAQRREFHLFSSEGRYTVVEGTAFRGGFSSPAAPIPRVKGTTPPRYAMYTIGPGRKTVSEREAMAGLLRDAVASLRGSSFEGYASGAGAFRLLAEDFTREKSGALPASAQAQVTSWCGSPLTELQRRREAAKRLVTTWRDRFASGGDRDSASSALELLSTSVELLSRLSAAHSSALAGTGPSEGGGSPGDLARKLAELDAELADALEGAL